MRPLLNKQFLKDRKLKILLLVDVFEHLTGGAERQIYELASRLDKDRFELIIGCVHGLSQAFEELEIPGVRTISFNLRRIYDFRGIRQGLAYVRLLRKEKIDVVVTYHFSSDIWGAFWARIAGVHHVFSNRRDAGFWRNKTHVWAYRMIDPLVQKIITVSEDVRSVVLHDEKVPAAKVEVVLNGVDCDRISNGARQHLDRSSLGLPAEAFLIVCVGNLNPVKGHRYLIAAAELVIPQLSRCHFLFAGDGSLRAELEKQASSLGVSGHVHFLGKRTDVPELISLSDICVLPSLSEGMSNAVLEYMAGAKPVIATNVGGNPELITSGENGILVDKENAAQLANAIKDLAQDVAKCKEIGKKGQDRVRQYFSIDRMIKRYEELFLKSVESKDIKILHLISSGGLYGAERVILTLCGQSGFGCQTLICAINNMHNPHLEIVEQARLLLLETRIVDSNGPVDLRTVAQLVRMVRREGIDLIHSHNYKSDIMAFFVKCITGSAWVATNHTWHSSDEKMRFYEMLDSFVLRFADMITVVSEDTRMITAKRLSVNNKVMVIANGIPVKDFAVEDISIEAVRQELGLRPGDFVIGIVGRLAPEKGHEIFIKAAKNVLGSRNDVQFLVVGDGPLMSGLHEIVKIEGLTGHFIFTGIWKNMPQIYAVMDIFVNSSYVEGLPMVLLEAMATSRPVIATAVGGVPCVVEHQKNGLLIGAGDPGALAEAILSLMKSESERQRLGREALVTVRARFSDERMAGQYHQVYSEIYRNI